MDPSIPAVLESSPEAPMEDDVAAFLKSYEEDLSAGLADASFPEEISDSYAVVDCMKKDEDGKKVRIVEETERYAHPDTGAIHLLLKNLDETWRNDDQTTVDLKKQRLELEKEKQEANNW